MSQSDIENVLLELQTQVIGLRQRRLGAPLDDPLWELEKSLREVRAALVRNGLLPRVLRGGALRGTADTDLLRSRRRVESQRSE